MEDKKSLVSVVMPCYNNGKYVGLAIESVQAQHYHDWELVIINDGSTDNSDEIIRRYANSDKRIKYVFQKNCGAAVARNRGVKEAKGEFICFLDADDWLAPQCLEDALTSFHEHSDCRLFYMKGENVDEASGKRTPFICYGGSYRSVLINGMSITIIIRRKDFLETGGFDESMKNGFEDWEFNIRFLYGNCNVIVSDRTLYYYRIHKSASRLSNKEEHEDAQVQVYVYKKNMEKYVENLGSPIQLYRWTERGLPRLLTKILLFRQKIMNFFMGI